jgi:hypothetical protein
MFDLRRNEVKHFICRSPEYKPESLVHVKKINVHKFGGNLSSTTCLSCLPYLQILLKSTFKQKECLNSQKYANVQPGLARRLQTSP